MARILYLEDDPADAHSLRTLLSSAGIRAELVVLGTAEDFRSALDQDDVALVLSDSGLPGLTALEALALVRQKRPGVEFVCVSGRPRSGTAESLIAAGAIDFVGKDDPERLTQIVRRALERNTSGPSGPHSIQDLLLVIQRLSMARSLATVQEIVRCAARRLSGADGATFVLREGDRCLYVDEDAIAPLWKGRTFPMSACISGWVMVHRQPAAIEDIYADERIPVEAYRPTFVRSLVMMPIRHLAPVGAIGVYWAEPHRATSEEIEMLQALADTTSVAIQNIELFADLERRVDDRTRELEIANAELEAFSSSVSHDLRAPLRAMRGLTDLIAVALETGDTDEARELLARVGGETGRMGRLIEDLLALARVTQTVIRHERVDLSDCARRILARLRASDPRRRVEEIVSENLVAQADPGLVASLLENLLSNAWKYTSKTAAARIEFFAETEGDGPQVLVIRDNGVGFDMTAADRLFKPFQRLHTMGEFPGTGIGLATARRIVQRHGGSIRIEAAPGVGATVRFTLAAQ